MTATSNRPDLLARLTDGISKLTTSEQWQRYLDFQGRFHRYSANNVVLISMQCPEASRVAGFNAWRKMGRFVRKGEKAIWILAPMVYRQAEAADGDDDRVIRGFKPVAVFDVSQTDGEELPEVCNRLTADAPAEPFERLRSVALAHGFSVEDAEVPGSVNGDCSHIERRIRVEVHNAPAQRVKTLAHELAHALLHERYDNRPLAELEAQSVAYVTCQALGVDSSDYSFGYVAGWTGDGDKAIAAIKASCERIQKAAAEILRPFEAEEREEAA